MKKLFFIMAVLSLNGCYVGYPAGYQDYYVEDTAVYSVPSTYYETQTTYVTASEPTTYIVQETAPTVYVEQTPSVVYMNAGPDIIYYDSPLLAPRPSYHPQPHHPFPRIEPKHHQPKPQMHKSAPKNHQQKPDRSPSPTKGRPEVLPGAGKQAPHHK